MAMKEATMKDSDAAPSNDNNPEHSLERRFLYQNPSTGGTSSTSLTVRQLCRMFCPPSSSTSRFTAESQLLGLLDNGEYDEEWKPAKSIPVLRHAASSAFYYTTPQKGQQGPVSCRQLAHAIRDGMDKVQVYGVTTGNQWTLLTALPDLVVALEAFQEGAKTQQQAQTQALNSNTAAAQEYDVSVMVYEDNISINDNKPEPLEEEEQDKSKESEIQNELEAFLNSTDKMGPKSNGGENTQQQLEDNSNNEETYESDGGTKYVKDPRTGNWIHEDLLPQQQQPPRKKAKTQHSTIGNNNSNNSTSTTVNNKDNNKNNNNTKKKSKKSKFAAKNAKCWIYITGLPPDTTEDELAKFCSKVGIIDLDPATQRPKIKLYRDSQHQCKGDASLCYARPESVALALQVLDEAPFRLTNSSSNIIIRVERAKFQQRGDHHTTKKKVSDAQRKVAKLATQQAVDWDEGEINGRLTGGRKGLHIIVLRNLFHASDLKDDNDDNDNNQKLELLERKVRSTCEQEFGTVEKITVFARKGVVVVKFAQPGAASDAVKAWHGRSFELFGNNNNNNNHTVQASFWDGVEDFTIRNEAAEQADMERRHDAFGDWIESQEELPPELRLKTET